MEYCHSFDASQFSQLTKPPMAHISASIGHFIIFIGGYRVSYENYVRTTTTFDRHHFLYYNVLNHQLNVLECKYNDESIGNFPTQYFFGSGMGSVTVGNRIYLFGGYSLSKQESGNALYYVEVKKSYSSENIKIALNTKPSAVLQFICGSHEEMNESLHANYPSYRDKCSIVYWNRKLFVFGGYGTNFRQNENVTMESYTIDPVQHNFLADNGDYVAGSGNRGWNNQLVEFNLSENRWTNPKCFGKVPCPRAAHCSSTSNNKMIIFGGRLGLANTADTIRSNQCFYLDLLNYQWTEIQFEGGPTCNSHFLGRSWSTMTQLSRDQMFVIGGFSGNNEPLNDAYLLNIDWESNSCKVTRQYQSMRQAVWDPYMDRSSWSSEAFDPLSRMWHSTSWASDCNLYIVGGCSNNLMLEIERIQHIMESSRIYVGRLYALSLWAFIHHIYTSSQFSHQHCYSLNNLLYHILPKWVVCDLLKIVL